MRIRRRDISNDSEYGRAFLLFWRHAAHLLQLLAYSSLEIARIDIDPVHAMSLVTDTAPPLE